MYLCMYTYISIQIDKLMETVSILLVTAFCLYQHHLFGQKPLCPSPYFVSVLILLFWGWHCFGLDLPFLFFFLGGRRTNTSKTIFLLVIKFIKTHGIQLLMLCVTLSLDGCEVLDRVKLTTVHLPEKISIWTIPYCFWV